MCLGNSLGVCSTPKLSKLVISLFNVYNAIQWVPTSAYSSRFITYVSILYVSRQIISRINCIKSRFIAIILLYFNVSQRMRRN